MFRPVQILTRVRAAFVLPDMIFASPKFFYFLVRRYSVRFASRRGGKSLAGRHLADGSEAIFAGFRLGGGTKSSTGEALFVPSAWSTRLADALVSVGIGRVAKELAWCELVARGHRFDKLTARR